MDSFDDQVVSRPARRHGAEPRRPTCAAGQAVAELPRRRRGSDGRLSAAVGAGCGTPHDSARTSTDFDAHVEAEFGADSGATTVTAMPTPDSVLEEQCAELLLRFRRRRIALSAAIIELTALARRPAMLTDDELASHLARIDHAHRGGAVKTHLTGPWAGAPTGRAIAGHLGVGKTKLRAVRDAYYTLYLGLRPYDADEPVTPTSDGPCVNAR